LVFAVPDDIARIVVRDAGTPTDTNALCTIHQDHGKDGAIPQRFKHLSSYHKRLFVEGGHGKIENT